MFHDFFHLQYLEIFNTHFFNCSICEGRALYAGYFPSWRVILVVVVNPFQNRDLSTSFLERQFRDACHALAVESPLLSDGATFKAGYKFSFFRF